MSEEKRPRGRPRLDGKPAGSVPRKPLKPGQRGGPRVGTGRPKGSKNIYSNESVKKLEELEFDPINMMVNKYREIQTMLDSGEIRVGSGAHAQLLQTQGALINNLMQYGYKKVPEKTEVEVTDKKPLTVKLDLGDNNKTKE